MLNLFFQHPLAFFIIFPGILLTIAIHELAHCWTADQLGDPTPRAHGRLSFNPLVHLDPLGVLAILLTNFGWGKPAPYDPHNLKDPVRDSALIAAAGAIANLIVAILLSFLLHLTNIPLLWLRLSLAQILAVNVYLAVFNLIPIKPLDGSKIMTAILPKRSALEYEQFMDRYGMMLLLLMILPIANGQAPVSLLIEPIANIILQLLIA
jgi:Zn-dependent protease